MERVHSTDICSSNAHVHDASSPACSDRSSSTSWVTSFDLDDINTKCDTLQLNDEVIDAVDMCDSAKNVITKNKPPENPVSDSSVVKSETRTKNGPSEEIEMQKPNPIRNNGMKNESKFEDVNDDNVDKVRNKIVSMWNNMKYGWSMKMKTNFRIDSPIWLLGNCYHKKMDDEEMIAFVGNENRRRSHSLIYGFSHFKGDFFSRLWFTYRREFPMLAGSSLTSDCGWGCMLRSGQMMLAQGFLMHFLGRQWNLLGEQTREIEKMHRNIIRWFGDVPSRQSPFSLHQLVSLGESSGKKAGDWYGPASVAFIFKQAMELAHKNSPLSQDVCVYVAQDCTVYKEDVIELCKSHPSKKWRGVIIFVPVRLGGEKLNPIYVPCVRAILAHEACVGIIGGRPRHSLYFIGWQEDSLIYLDPHYCQPVVDVLCDDFAVQSFHCSSPRKMSFSKMDPSCTIGFYCKTENDLDFFLSTIKDVLIPPKQKADYPIFIVAEGKAADAQVYKSGGENGAEQKDKILKVTHCILNGAGETEHVIEGEEFVVL